MVWSPRWCCELMKADHGAHSGLVVPDPSLPQGFSILFPCLAPPEVHTWPNTNIATTGRSNYEITGFPVSRESRGVADSSGSPCPGDCGWEGMWNSCFISKESADFVDVLKIGFPNWPCLVHVLWEDVLHPHLSGIRHVGFLLGNPWLHQGQGCFQSQKTSSLNFC